MIQVSNLTKRYGPRTAIEDLNFEVKKGEIVGFLGPNGAGKSTTMKILSGFMPTTEGRAIVADFDVFENPVEVKRNVGFLPENPPVYPEMQVADYLDFVARIKGVASGEVKSAVENAIEKTALGEVRRRLIGNLSKGYRQRVGVAQALVNNPRVLILDEPTVGLDPRQIIEIRDLVRNLKGEHTVILSTHILPEVTATCQRVIVINRGRIVTADTIENLTSKTSGGSILHLSVRDPRPAAVEALKKIPGVATVSPNGSAGHLVIQVDPSAGGVRDALLSTALQQNMGVLEFSAERLSLEQIFLKLITQETSAHESAN